MSEVYIIVWTSDQLQLHRIPSESSGWRSLNPPLSSVFLERPTRLSRLKELAQGQLLVEAIHQLLDSVDLNLPLWFLLPQGWGYQFYLEPPPLESAEEVLEHIKWEVKLRLPPDNGSYRFLLYSADHNTPWLVHIVRSEVLAFITDALRRAEVEVTGIALTPLEGEGYSFERPGDLRDSVPLGDEEEREEEAVSIQWKTLPKPSYLIGGGVVVLIALLLYLYLPTVNPPPPSPPPQIKPSTAEPSVSPSPLPTPEESRPAVEAGRKPSVSSPETATTVLQPESRGISRASPLRMLVEAGAGLGRVILCTLADKEIKLLVGGSLTPTQLQERLGNQAGIPSVERVSRWEENGQEFTLFVVRGVAWRAGDGVRLADWEQLASRRGLQAQGRALSGSADKVFPLLDDLWSNPVSSRKVYIGWEDPVWKVTVQ